MTDSEGDGFPWLPREVSVGSLPLERAKVTGLD